MVAGAAPAEVAARASAAARARERRAAWGMSGSEEGAASRRRQSLLDAEAAAPG
jgi:hypothetical protein